MSVHQLSSLLSSHLALGGDPAVVHVLVAAVVAVISAVTGPRDWGWDSIENLHIRNCLEIL